MTSSRRLLAIGVLAGAAVSACHGSKASVTCTSFASAEALCESERCDPTWAAVETNHAYCSGCSLNTWGVGDCGDYHVLTYLGIDYGGSYYYRRDTGALVAAQTFAPPNPVGTCSYVGTAPFKAPAECATATLSMLPTWCSPDAGAPGERVFPCCSNVLAQCDVHIGAGGGCPATWAQAQSQAPSLCAPQSGGTDPELGSCGADQVFRYRAYGATPLSLYYDASGALLAAIDETLNRCEYGPIAGLSLPACDAPLAPVCPDGGAAP